MNPTSDASLAAMLGLSKSAISKLKGQGMPTHSFAAAVEWRERNLNPAMIKRSHSPKEASGHRDGQVPGETLASRANALASLADGLIGTASFDDVAWRLKEAMRLVPLANRAAVTFSPRLREALVGDIHKVVHDRAIANGLQPLAWRLDDPPGPLGRFWWGVFCGGVIPLEDLPADLYGPATS